VRFRLLAVGLVAEIQFAVFWQANNQDAPDKSRETFVSRLSDWHWGDWAPHVSTWNLCRIYGPENGLLGSNRRILEV
jgi:hypothetical protein